MKHKKYRNAKVALTKSYLIEHKLEGIVIGHRKSGGNDFVIRLTTNAIDNRFGAYFSPNNLFCGKTEFFNSFADVAFFDEPFNLVEGNYLWQQKKDIEIVLPSKQELNNLIARLEL